MPMKRERYPADWPAISRRIRARANDRCERCGVPNQVWRRKGSDEWTRNRGVVEGWALDGEGATRIVLTVAHLGAPRDDGSAGDKHDKMDVRDCNLQALCQRCHLALDQRDHVVNASRTRAARRAAGTPALFGPADGGVGCDGCGPAGG